MADFLTEVMGALSGAEFDEIPVTLEEFVTSEKYLNQPPLSPNQYLMIEAGSQIYRKETLISLYGEEEGLKRYSQTYNECIFALGKGSCTIDTELYDASTGRWTPMSELMLSDNRVASISNDGEAFSQDATEVFWSCDAETYEVTTSKGFKIKVNAGHKFMTKGFALTPLCELDLGDRIAVAAGLPLDNPVPIDEREVKLLGYWLGDGMMPLDLPGRRTINMDFSDNDVAALEEYVSILKTYGDNPSVVKHKSKAMWYVRSGLRTCPAALEIARKHGLWGARARNKKIPDAVWGLPGSQLAIFLSRLWGTDGCVYMKKNRKTVTPTLEYTTISEELAVGIQRLLQRVGIIAGLRSRIPTYTYNGVKKQGQRAYYLTISDKEGFARFDSFISMMDKTTSQGIDIYEGRGDNSQYEEGVYWDSIKSIKEVGTEELFTVTAPEFSNFVAGGVLNGNSGK